MTRRLWRATAASCAVATLAGWAAACTPDHVASEAPSQLAATSSARRTATVDTTPALVALGESTYFRSEYDSATALWTRALHASEQAGDSAWEARTLTWLGLAAWRQGRYADARTLGERALRLKTQLNLTGDLFKSYNALGLLAHNQGRYADARALFERAASAARAAGDSAGVAKAAGNLGLVRTDVGEFGRAREDISTMRAWARGAGDVRTEANALANLGMVDIRLGDLRAAVPTLEAALQLYRRLDYAPGEENALGQLGTAYDALGEPQRAFAYLDSALRIARQHGLRQQEADDLQLLAGLYRSVGDYQRALEYLTRARALSVEVGLSAELGDVARDEARALAALGHLRTARERVADALRRHRGAGATFEQLADHLLQAELAQQARDARGAADALAIARAEARTLGTGTARAALALTEARIADADRKPAAVLRSLDALAPHLALAGSEVEWEAHALRARALARAGRLLDAAAAGRAAVGALERVRSRIGSGPLRTSYTSDRAAVYAELAVVLHRLGRMDEALEVADAARGRALVEQLAAARSTLNDEVHHGLRGTRGFLEGEALLRRIDALVERIREADAGERAERGGAAAGGPAELVAELVATRREYEAVVARAAAADPRGATLLGAVGMRATDVRKALLPGEVLIEYLVTPQRLLTFVATASGTRVLDTAVTAEALATRVRLAREMVGRLHAVGGSRPQVLRSLYDVLVAPAERRGLLADASALIVVPHEALSYMPFAALQNARTGRFLIEEHSLLVLPSGAALAAVRHRSSGAPLADTARTVAAFAPFPERLRNSGPEATTVARRMRGRAVVGVRATERALRAALASDHLVHVATHGALNASSPLFSSIALARGPASSADDGRLELHEVLGTRARSTLVFLSGCETGLGTAWATTHRRGEDYATLAQAFLHAGVRNVVATLWQIDDRSAAVFVDRFYRALPGRPPAEALAVAQRAMLRDPRFASPYFWAAYQLGGDGRVVMPRVLARGPTARRAMTAAGFDWPAPDDR